MALLPLVASPYALLLMLPFVGYGIALLGFNLLFGTTGLLSFGHALFLGVGAYTAAGLTSKFGILSFEIILIAAALASALVSLVIGMLFSKLYWGYWISPPSVVPWVRDLFANGYRLRGWLAVIYVLLFVPLSAFLMVTFLAGWGFADNWRRNFIYKVS